MAAKKIARSAVQATKTVTYADIFNDVVGRIDHFLDSPLGSRLARDLRHRADRAADLLLELANELEEAGI